MSLPRGGVRLFALAVCVALAPEALRAQQPPEPKAKAPPAATSAAAKPTPKAASRLNARQQAFLKNELLPAYQAGDPAALVKLIADQIARQSEQQNAAFDEALAEQKAPGLGKMLTDARMQLARVNAGMNAPELTVGELVLMLVEIDRQVTELVATAKKVELFQEPLPSPASLTEFRDLLWNAHVQNNQLINAAFLAGQGRLLLTSPLIAKVKNPTAAQKAAFAIDFAKQQSEIVQLQQDLNERAVELRLDRIQFAKRVLEESKDLKQRFLAAYAVGVDGEILLLGFQNYRGQFQRERLRSPTLTADLRIDIDHYGKELAGDLVKKSELLFAGLHWWRRGRYGRGPEGNGLLKSEEALANPAAQIALFMPMVTPAPTDPMKGGQQSPDYDRRHHWTWAWEDRQFETVGTGSTTSKNSNVTGTQNKNLGHWDGVIDGRFY